MHCSICGEFDPDAIPLARGINRDETARLIADLGQGTKCVHWRYNGEILTFLGVANPFPRWAMPTEWIVPVALELGAVFVSPLDTKVEPSQQQPKLRTDGDGLNKSQ
jgi:hypothetical protein